MVCKSAATIIGVATVFCAPVVFAAPTLLDSIGVTPVRQADGTLTGAEVRVAQVEASEGPSRWQVNPAAVFQPAGLFTYISADGSSASYPNALGGESGHAGAVGYSFYGGTAGVVPGVLSVDNYEATYFVLAVVPSLGGIRAPVVNQSFVGGLNLPLGPATESHYDNYVAMHNLIIVSGAGNGGPPQQPSTAYNVISVAAFGGASSIGPTTNGGRAKPDITAPGGATSYTTPLVAGVAAMLHQAAARNEAGAGTATVATNARTMKALLLNGAVKPAGWTNSSTAPMDARYGAGILNAYHSWQQLRGGRRTFIESTAAPPGGNHPPGSAATNVLARRGWDLNSVTSSPISDGVNHYYFKLDGAETGRFSGAATLVWQRQLSQSEINNLDLFLYDVATGQLVATSQSTVDNVEHIFLPSLPAGHYDLQVLKRGGTGLVSPGEIYAVAFDFQPVKLSITTTPDQTVTVSWPAATAGFGLQTATNLAPNSTWTTVVEPIVLTNGQATVSMPATDARRFYRLAR